MIELNLKHLHFNYADRILLKNVNLTIKSQGITGVTGCNGSGKSTFLRLLHGLIKPTSGHINWKSDIATPKISMVFQKPLMLRRSVLANMQFVAKLRQDKIDPHSYLQQVDLTHLALKSARSLSGGEQQKLAIARVLVLRPDILLLDEPTAHLDEPTTLKIENVFHNLSQQGTKIFLVSHDSDQIQRLAYDRLHLQSGELIITR